MKIGRQDRRSSAISTSNEETIVVRGRDLARDLIGSISFTEHFWLLVTGSMPSAAQRRVLDATLVAIAEHGMVPSVQASRMTLAAAPEALQGAVAAGILGCGSVMLGSSEAAGQFVCRPLRTGSMAASSAADAAQTVVREYRAAKAARSQDTDTRCTSGRIRASQRLFEVAGEAGGPRAGTSQIARDVEAAVAGSGG